MNAKQFQKFFWFVILRQRLKSTSRFFLAFLAAQIDDPPKPDVLLKRHHSKMKSFMKLLMKKNENSWL